MKQEVGSFIVNALVNIGCLVYRLAKYIGFYLCLGNTQISREAALKCSLHAKYSNSENA
jgi:hypothetical protein